MFKVFHILSLKPYLIYRCCFYTFNCNLSPSNFKGIFPQLILHFNTEIF